LSGKSFKGLGQYLVHEPKRVAWTATRNLAHDDMPSAIHEMYQTYSDAELLKELAGIRGGGNPLEKSVKHISLNWSPEQEPTKGQMMEAAEGFLKHMKWDQHQAVLVAHDDKAHDHVHIILNAVHPETGLKLDEFLERRRAEHWGLAYERENGKILCEQRLLDPEDREPSPTRQTWSKLKESEQAHQQAEETRRAYDAGYLNWEGNRAVIDGEEWKLLKEVQREEREAFFAGGKSAYGDLRKEIYREVREEFRAEWRDYFEAKKVGLDADRLADMKTDILDRQNTVLDERRGEACTSLRQQRDQEYATMLAGQQELRSQLADRQSEGLSSPHLLDLAYSRDGATGSFENGVETVAVAEVFRQSADEVCNRQDAFERADALEPVQTSAEDPRVKSGIDGFGGIGLGAIGGLALITERLFDGFFGDKPAPHGENAKSNQQPQAEPHQERPRQNPFQQVADAARRNAEIMEEQQRSRAYWEDRDRGRWD
jgi:hypothetical protein